MNVIIKIHDDPDAVARALINDALPIFNKAAQLHIALSGGNTPKILFQLWATEFRHTIDWTKIHFFWGDERCVPPNDEQSNYGVARDLLFNHIDIPNSNIHRIMGEVDPNQEVARYEEEIQRHVKIQDGRPRMEIVLLGLGRDGHTASIFPHQMDLLKSIQDCAVATHPVSGQQRITLTGKTINNAVNVIFLVTGQDKAELLAKIIERPEEYPQYPASHIKPVGSLFFYLDQAAASQLSEKSRTL